MDYLKIYNSLIDDRAKENRFKGDGKYYEIHHIAPRCLGGVDDKSNLILLTAREHFIAHRLLAKIHKDSLDLKIAVLLMATAPKDGNNVVVNSRLYEILRTDVSEARIYAITPKDIITFDGTMKCPVSISNRLRSIANREKISNPVKVVMKKIVCNLLYANFQGKFLSYPRSNNGKVYSSCGEFSVSSLLYAEQKLIKLGLISEIISDSKSPLSKRMRAKIKPSDKLISLFGEYTESLIELNEK